MTTIASVAAGGADVRQRLGCSWARASDAGRQLLRRARESDAVRVLVWLLVAGARSLDPLRWWVAGFVLLDALSQSQATLAGRRLITRVAGQASALRRRSVADAQGAARVSLRWASGAGRQLLRWASAAGRALVWLRVAGASMLSPVRWWVTGFVLLDALAQSQATLAARGLLTRVAGQVSALRRRSVTDSQAAGRRLLRWASGAGRALAWLRAAGASMLSPLRWWVTGFVLLNALSQSRAMLAARGLIARALGPVRARRRSAADARSADAAGPRRPRRWYPTPRNAFRVLVWTVVVAGVGAFAASLAAPAWHGLRGQQLLIVTSGSMSPFVEAGDAAVLQEIDDPSQLRVGQVVTFWPPGSKHLLTHRVVDLQMLPVLEEGPGGQMVPRLDAAGEPIMRPYVYTKGDANRTRDPNATPLSLVRGVVVASHPGWGRWLGWAQSPTGRLTMLMPPLVMLGALEIVEAFAERRRRPVRRTYANPEVTDALGSI